MPEQIPNMTRIILKTQVFWYVHCVMGWIITDVSKNRSSITVVCQDAFPGTITIQNEGNTFLWDVGIYSLNAERPTPEDSNPNTIRCSEDFKSRWVLSDQRCDCFVTTLPVVRSPCEGISCCFYGLTCPTHTWVLASLWGMPGKWELSLFSNFFLDVWRVFNKLRFLRSS